MVVRALLLKVLDHQRMVEGGHKVQLHLGLCGAECTLELFVPEVLGGPRLLK